MKLELRPEREPWYDWTDDKYFWLDLISKFNRESNLLWTTEFEEWLFTNYNIRTLHEDELAPNTITGYEIDEVWATYYRLKYGGTN